MRIWMTALAGLLGAGVLTVSVLRAAGPAGTPAPAAAPASAPATPPAPTQAALRTPPAATAAPRPLSAAAVPEPGRVEVPPALRARVPMLELSGLAWSPALDRYLVVIDDSLDLDSNVRHAPFVLALDRNGKLDADPVPISGVDEVDDAEALAAGAPGTFYLLTSHSPNKKGEVHRSRRQLLELRLEHRQLKVTGAIDLLHGKGDIGEQIEKMGLKEGTPVDIEGLAYRDGALFLGLKAPLLADGSAAILRLERLAEAFERGKVPKHALSTWAEVKLTVPSKAGPMVSQGIADVFFATDGALYLCANSPKGAPTDGGGALWRVAAPKPGKLEAQLVRRFSQLKPEGVTAAPQGGALTMVFDRDRQDPFWMTWPLAH